jgi:hypothetical protein
LNKSFQRTRRLRLGCGAKVSGGVPLNFLVGRNMILIFNDDQLLPPEELARLAGASFPLIRRMIAGGCPTVDGKLSYSGFLSWAAAHYTTALPDFQVGSFPACGYHCDLAQQWMVRPVSEWELHEEDGWLDVGGPGVDGISWALRRGEDGVFAYYPIEREFVWKAADGASLLSAWQHGTLSI